MKQTPPSDKLVILFADISGSTALYDKLGNELAVQIVTRTLSILIKEVAAYQGIVIKTIGDEIMCAFASVTAAANAACTMQLAIETQHPGGEHPIFVRIGLHYGEVIQEENDVFGDTVNIAARVTAITRARQILTTRAVADMLLPEYANMVRPLMRTKFSGKEETFEVFQILWDAEDTMSTRVGMSAFRKPVQARNELLLRYRKNIMTLNEQNKSAVLGRGDTCDFEVWVNLASREHARIDYNFGKFLLTDHSVNGTYIQFSDHQTVQLHHQQIVLHGRGSISLGQSFADNPSEVIEYIVQ